MHHGRICCNYHKKDIITSKLFHTLAKLIPYDMAQFFPMSVLRRFQSGNYITSKPVLRIDSFIGFDHLSVGRRHFLHDQCRRTDIRCDKIFSIISIYRLPFYIQRLGNGIYLS